MRSSSFSAHTNPATIANDTMGSIMGFVGKEASTSVLTKIAEAAGDRLANMVRGTTKVDAAALKEFGVHIPTEFTVVKKVQREIEWAVVGQVVILMLAGSIIAILAVATGRALLRYLGV